MKRRVFSAYADECSNFAELSREDRDCTIPFDLSQQVSLIGNIRCTPNIELRAIGGRNITDLLPSELKYIRTILKRNGIKVSGISTPFGKGDYRCGIPEYGILRAFDIARYFGTKNIRVFSFKGTDEVLVSYGLLAAAMGKAEREGFNLSIENENGTYCSSPDNCRSFLEASHDSAKFVLDPANFIQHQIRTGERVDIPRLAEDLLDKITCVHVKDWSLTEDVGMLVGEGHAGWNEIVPVLKKNPKIYFAMEPKLRYGGSRVTERNNFFIATRHFLDKYGSDLNIR